MKVSNELPPNYEAIVKTFPVVKKRQGVVFTYGDTIYAPTSGGTIPKDLMVHESYHSEIQNKTSPALWWERYLKDPEFRAEQELGAYQRQYKSARKRYSKASLRGLLERIAGDLSSGIYGNIYTLDEAKKLIKGKYQ